MIHLHTWSTPNGRKISVMLEEIGAPYEVHTVDIGKEAQCDPTFLAVAPNNKIPAITDDTRQAFKSQGHDGPLWPISGAYAPVTCPGPFTRANTLSERANTCRNLA